MKVLNLLCAQGHTFEGWFASETEFVAQNQALQILCPACGDPSVTKQVSAPRFMRSGRGERLHGKQEQPVPTIGVSDVTSVWFAMARHVLAHTADVGDRFAEEARKIHYGETPIRGIRGTATREETLTLLEDGIDVLPFSLPQALKEPMQ
ncbi:MAG: DUF1178 family protein [Rhodoferax sp.]|uniref:DUF1178 family protein n=1 Tax=Candidatus Aalborgicola defluviihabitans TaxID=3386187 RepID=UPI003909B394|nr:DUF1178 family protein [Burkholderiales bacterium]